MRITNPLQPQMISIVFIVATDPFLLVRGEIAKNPNKDGGSNKNTEEYPKYAIHRINTSVLVGDEGSEKVPNNGQKKA